MLGGLHCGTGEKMDIGDEGHVATGGAQFTGNRAEGFGGFFIGSGDADDFATGFREGEGLFDGRGNVLRGGGRHGLYPQGLRTPDGKIADANLTA